MSRSLFVSAKIRFVWLLPVYFLFSPNSAGFQKMKYFGWSVWRYFLLLVFVLYNLKTGDALKRVSCVSGDTLKRVTGDALKRVIADSLKRITVVVAHCFRISFVYIYTVYICISLVWRLFFVRRNSVLFGCYLFTFFQFLQIIRRLTVLFKVFFVLFFMISIWFIYFKDRRRA